MDISTRILFTTAFVDIGRKDWSKDSRKNEIYFENFYRMLDEGFEYPLIVYTHTWAIEHMRSTRTFPSNISFVDVDRVDTFLKEPYMSRETAIMKSASYIEKVAEWRRPSPEHTNPKYTLITHSKMSFLRHTRIYNPKCLYYGWIDFGKHAHVPGNCVPRAINFSLLGEYIHCGAVKLVESDRYVTEEDFLETNQMTIYAFSFIIHNLVFDELYGLYEAKFAAWQRRGIADDEQNLLYQLYQDRKDLFKIFKIKNCDGLYSENLNAGATPTLLHPTSPSDAVFALKTPAQTSTALHVPDMSKPLVVLYESDQVAANAFLTTAHRNGWETIWLNMPHTSITDRLIHVLFLKHIPASKHIVLVNAAETVCAQSPLVYMETLLQKYRSPCVVCPTRKQFAAPFLYMQTFLYWMLTNDHKDISEALHVYMQKYPDRMNVDTDGHIFGTFFMKK